MEHRTNLMLRKAVVIGHFCVILRNKIDVKCVLIWVLDGVNAVSNAGIMSGEE